MKKVKSIVVALLLILLGMNVHRLLQQTVQMFSERTSGNAGGEVLVFPLIILLIWFGWYIRDIFKK